MFSETDKNEKKNSFEWSLKPLQWVTRIAVGVPMIDYAKKRSLSAILFTFFLGLCIFLCNILINGPRAINVSNFDWMKKNQEFDSPFSYFNYQPDAVVQLVADDTTICFFIAMPLIQTLFLVMTFCSNGFISTLLLIQEKMKLSCQFYQKCRKRCITTIFILILVKY